MNRRLDQRLTSGNFNQRTADFLHLSYQLIDGTAFTLPEGIFRITIMAPQGAASKADKYAGQPRPGRFTLDAVEDLIDL